MRSLKGFQRVSLAPGESKTVTFQLGFDELAFFDNSGDRASRTIGVHGLGRRGFQSDRIDALQG